MILVNKTYKMSFKSNIDNPRVGASTLGSEGLDMLVHQYKQ